MTAAPLRLTLAVCIAVGLSACASLGSLSAGKRSVAGDLPGCFADELEATEAPVARNGAFWVRCPRTQQVWQCRGQGIGRMARCVPDNDRAFR